MAGRILRKRKVTRSNYGTKKARYTPRPGGFRGKRYRRYRVKRTGYRSRMLRMANSGITLRLIQGETVIPQPATGAVDGALNYILTAFDIGTTNSVFAKYTQLFDEYRLHKVVFNVWLNSADEESKVGFQIPRLYSCYDPNSRIATSTSPKDASTIMLRPNHKMRFMRPGVKYRFTIYPKYGIFNVQSGSTANVTTRIADAQPSPWRPSGYAPGSATDNACNCFFISLVGNFLKTDTPLTFTREYFYQFRGRTNGFNINEV